ncbi:MAG: chromate efflux transporter [Candidatus Velthaea sp.]
MREIFLTFLRLGSTSFGGPIAHLAYFRREFVERRAWLHDDTFAQIVAFCAVLPGPTSSQVGMVVGTIRGGTAGAVLAWLGFTAPSAVALATFALVLRSVEGTAGSPAWLTGGLAGLTAAATAVVAQAAITLARTQCPDRETRTIGLGAVILALSVQSLGSFQWLPIAMGAVVGAFFLRRDGRVDVAPLPLAIPRRVSIGCAIAFVVLVAGVLLAAHTSLAAAFLATIVRAGSLVFGGGHVVLPLLQSVVTNGLMPARDFFAGYGAAQAVPGPLFTFAAFLGAANRSPLAGVTGAGVATVLIFVPSFLLVFALLPAWNALRANRAMGGALRGANASVAGILAAVLYSPMITTLGTSNARIAIALGAFALIDAWRLPPWTVVVLCAALGAGIAAAGAPV